MYKRQGFIDERKYREEKMVVLPETEVLLATTAAPFCYDRREKLNLAGCLFLLFTCMVVDYLRTA